MAEKIDIQKKKCITPEARASYPALFEPKSFQDQAAKYSLTLVFSKKTDLKDMKRAAFNAAVEKWGAKEKWPKKLKMPFRDGDEDKPDQPAYKNTIFVTTSAKQRPGLVNQRKERIQKDDEPGFYAGCYCRAELIAFAYDTAGNVGVSFALQNVQKTRDGEPLSGRRQAEDVFEEVDDGSEDSSSYSDDDSDSDDATQNMGF